MVDAESDTAGTPPFVYGNRPDSIELKLLKCHDVSSISE